MDRQTFEHEMNRAKALKAENPDYWMGYQRGLRRRYRGEKFGTDDEHAFWMSLSEDVTQSREDRGQGYRDGYIPEYCTQNDGECWTCSLMSYGLDCQNNTV